MMSSQSVQVKIELGHRASLREKPSTEGFTHDWTVYVRGPEGCNIANFVEKVVFHLDQSFNQPERVVTAPPYLVAEKGSAGFLLLIDIHFKSKEEPKKIRFLYDLFLKLDDTPVSHIRCEKFTFQNPTDEFKKKLLKAGGTLVGSNGLDNSGNGKQFTDLFGPPITADGTKETEKRPVKGVDLANIVRDSTLYSEGGEKIEHPVIAAIKQLKISVEKSERGETTEAIHKLKSECDIDLARRCMAGKNDAYKVLMEAVLKNKTDNDLLKEIFIGLISLTNGQPDVLDDEGGSFLVENLTKNIDDKDLLVITLKLIRNTCTKHESNRQMFVKKKLITQLVNILIVHKSEPAVVIEACGLLRCLTYDDDIRVPFGQAHEHAKMIVNEGNCLKMLLELCEEYASNTIVLSELFATLSVLVVRDEFCKAVMDMGGLDSILNTFQNNIVEKGIVKQALGLIKALAGNDEVKDAVVSKGGIELILSAMTQHQANSAIAELGCGNITTIVLRNPPHCAKVIKCQGHHVIIQAMKFHTKEESVQKQGCMALRNLVARTREYCEPILELGAETLINTALTNHKICNDEAKAALRDLGCHVELKELWKGEKGELAY